MLRKIAAISDSIGLLVMLSIRGWRDVKTLLAGSYQHKIVVCSIHSSELCIYIILARDDYTTKIYLGVPKFIQTHPVSVNPS